jgi:hypothetical protein
MRNRNDFPNPGAIVSYLSPPQAMPASVTIPKPIGHDGVIYTGTYAGFLGARHDPFELKPPGEVKAAPPHSLDLLDGIDAYGSPTRTSPLEREPVARLDAIIHELGALGLYFVTGDSP